MSDKPINPETLGGGDPIAIDDLGLGDVLTGNPADMDRYLNEKLAEGGESAEKIWAAFESAYGPTKGTH